MSLKRLLTAFSMTLREFLRRKGMILFMVAIPIVSFASVYVALPETPVTLEAIENDVHVEVDLDQVALFGGVMALIYVAIMAGITGFYVMASAVRTDRRLILAGYQPLELVGARCLVLLVLDAGIMLLQLGIMLFFFTPKQFLPYALSLFWGAMSYGLYGGLFATLIRNELGGLLAVVFFANFDVGYFQLPGYSTFLDEWWLKLLPGYFPVQLAIDAGFTSVADLLISSFWTIPHGLVVVGLMLASYNRVTRVRPFLEREGHRLRWWVVGLALLLVGAFAGIGGYFYWSAQPPVVLAEGRVDAPNAKVVATTTGSLSILSVEEGSNVAGGDVIAWIEDATDASIVPVSAPLSGRVTTLNVRKDEIVVLGDVLAVIYKSDAMVVALEVDENNIQKVSVGQRVEVTSGSLNLKTTATVKSVALTPLPPDPGISERTRRIRKYEVKCRLDQIDPRLLIGMAVKGRIFVDSGGS